MVGEDEGSAARRVAVVAAVLCTRVVRQPRPARRPRRPPRHCRPPSQGGLCGRVFLRSRRGRGTSLEEKVVVFLILEVLDGVDIAIE